MVRLAPDIDMWVDDEGLLKPGSRINQLSSYVATRFNLPFQVYVGTAAFTGGIDQRGYTQSLSSSARQRLIDLIEGLRTIPGARP